MRKDEFSSVLNQYHGMGLNVKGVDASERFLTQLAGVSDPERKRKIIGNTFIDVFDDESKKSTVQLGWRKELFIPMWSSLSRWMDLQLPLNRTTM